ncbi:MAG: hypothetical protein ACRBFS_06060 [Aureispira sp.]
MKNSATRFYPDVVLQSLVFFPMILCYFLAVARTEFLIGALLIQIGVGVVQVFSGLYYSITRKSRWHRSYTISAISYVLFIWALLVNVGGSSFVVWFVVFSGIIPVCIAIWYLIKSLNYHQNYNPPLAKPSYGAEDLLDDILVEN